MIIRYSEFWKIRSNNVFGGRIIGGYSCFIVRAFKFLIIFFLILSLYCNIYFVLLHYFSIMR